MKDSEYFMGVAEKVALKSKDPSTKVGAIIIDQQKRVISTGFNGMVAGCDEASMWEPRSMKYLTVIHAELNAILYAHRNLHGHVMYCTHAPCVNCLKHSLQAGIRTIYYGNSDIMKRTEFEANVAVQRLIKGTDALIISTTTRMTLDEEISLYHSTKAPMSDGEF